MFRTVEVSNAAFAPPGIRFVTVKSAALGQRADLLLYVPPQAADLHDVPLVLLLHGAYSSHWAWAFKGAAHLTAQRLIDEGVIPPMVMVMPSDGLWGDGSGYVAHGGQDFECWIAEEVPAAASAACDACSEASPLFVAGLSMGGFGALRLAGRYPQRFVAAAGHSSVTDATQMDALMAESRDGWAGTPADTSVLDALRTASPWRHRFRPCASTADATIFSPTRTASFMRTCCKQASPTNTLNMPVGMTGPIGRSIWKIRCASSARR